MPLSAIQRGDVDIQGYRHRRAAPISRTAAMKRWRGVAALSPAADVAGLLVVEEEQRDILRR